MNSDPLDQQLIALILDDSQNFTVRDEALYNILNERLKPRLTQKYFRCKGNLRDSMDDILQEFFLYLRGRDDSPYKVFRNIREPLSLYAWLIKTFSNFVSKKVRTTKSKQIYAYVPDIDELPKDLIHILSTLIPYCCQELAPLQRFIFLRAVLTIMDKSKSIPEKNMADAMGISYVYYRVLTCRVKRKVLEWKDVLLHGCDLDLDSASQSLSEKLKDFSDWYPLLYSCYLSTIEQLPYAKAVHALISSSDKTLHEGRIPYGYRIKTFYAVLDSYLRESLA